MYNFFPDPSDLELKRDEVKARIKPYDFASEPPLKDLLNLLTDKDIKTLFGSQGYSRLYTLASSLFPDNAHGG